MKYKVFEGKPGRTLHRKKSASKISSKGILRPKTGYPTRKKTSPAEESMLKSTAFCGRYLFGRNGSRKCHYPTALIFIKQNNFNMNMTVLKIFLKPFHHACGHQASFSVGKMDDSIFSVNFFYIIFVYQKCPMATHKIAVQYAC